MNEASKEKELQLVQAAQSGNTDAMNELVLSTQERIYYYCLKMLRNEQDAEDASQDILMIMFAKLNTLREPAAFHGWLQHIIVNRCNNMLSRGPREVQIPEDEEGNSLIDEFENFDEQTVPDKALDNSETQRMMVELVDALPDAQRLTTLMFYYDEMNVKEIASAMDVSEGTVKSRLNYSRKRIKEGVLDYEKHGVKLYGLSPLPFLTYFLRKEAASHTFSPEALGKITRAVAEAAGTTAAGAGTAAVQAGLGGVSASAVSAAASGAAHVVSTKVVAGILAASIAVGGASTVVIHNHVEQQAIYQQQQQEESLRLQEQMIQQEIINQEMIRQQQEIINQQMVQEEINRQNQLQQEQLQQETQNQINQQIQQSQMAQQDMQNQLTQQELQRQLQQQINQSMLVP